MSLVVIGFAVLNVEKQNTILIHLTFAPKELVEYLKPPIIYLTCHIQRFNDTNCGQWCLYVLRE